MALVEVGLTLPQYRVLGLLAEGASIPSALADRLTVRRPTITAVVDGLEARGLVERAGAADDRRSVTHTITAKGRRALHEADEAVDARLADIAASLEDPRLTEQALGSMALWRMAMRAHHAARTVRT